MTQSSSPAVVHESSRNVNILWGFLSVAFAAALARGHFGAETSAGRLTIDLVFGGLLVASLVIWVITRRRPARLEITHDAITLAYEGKPGSIALRATGELYLHRPVIGTKVGPAYLKVTGSDDAIPIDTFNFALVRDACRAKGWRFTGDG